MSTRGYYGILKKGKLKGTYNHFDSYPSGLGVKIVEQLNNIEGDKIKKLSEAYNYIKMVKADSKPSAKAKKLCLELGAYDKLVSNQSIDDWYCLLRNTQGNILCYVDKVLPYMINNNDFLEDELFCEWAYILDLDEKKFKVYINGIKDLVQEQDLLNIDLDQLLSLEQCDEE